MRVSDESMVTARRLGWRAGSRRSGGRRILGPVDLEVRRGECLAVVGPNGAGKTTLLRLVTGLLSASEGELSWGETPYAEMSRSRLARRIAYVPQVRPSRVPLTVEQLVLLGRYPYLKRWQLAPRAADFAAVEQALRRVDALHLRKRPLRGLSGGELQTVYVAAALAQGSELLVLDEPTTHLDPRHQREIAALLKRLAGERTVLTATHELNFASLVADRILGLRDGRARALGPPAEVLREEVLMDLFEAPFETVRGGKRPVTVLGLEP
jgi:iron complex transport system ATP-binding protein